MLKMLPHFTERTDSVHFKKSWYLELGELKYKKIKEN
jgi:hypothetical protein